MFEDINSVNQRELSYCLRFHRKETMIKFNLVDRSIHPIVCDYRGWEHGFSYPIYDTSSFISSMFVDK